MPKTVIFNAVEWRDGWIEMRLNEDGMVRASGSAEIAASDGTRKRITFSHDFPFGGTLQNSINSLFDKMAVALAKRELSALNVTREGTSYKESV